jgi:hypothetical protein
MKSRNKVLQICLSILLFLSANHVFRAAPLNIYRVVLKSGKSLEAVKHPTSMDGNWIFTTPQGQILTIPISKINLEATQKANLSFQQSPQPGKKEVVTNDTLKSDETRTNDKSPSSSPPETTTKKTSSDPYYPESTPMHESYWRERKDNLQKKLVAVQTQISETEQKLKDMTRGYYANDVWVPDALYQMTQEKLDTLQKGKKEVEAQIEALEEEARSKNVPPGWLR